jgi:outer membrane receptor protein involved in Fe transport
MDCQAKPETIIVVAPRLPEAPSDEAYSSYPIDPQALNDAIRLDDALRSAPGVSLFRRGDSGPANATTQGVSVRAIAPSGAGRALVTLDGMPLNDPFGGWVLWGALAPDTIARADILRGVGAGPYGAGALTGVVALEERRRPGALFSAEGGEQGYRRASGVGEADNQTLSLMLAASGEHSDGWVPVHARRGAADADLWFETFAGVGRAEWRGDGVVFSARASGYNDARSAGLAGAASASNASNLSFTLAAPEGPISWRLQAWAVKSTLANISVTTAPDRSTATPANDQTSTPATGWGANAALRWSNAAAGLELGTDVRAAAGETHELFSYAAGHFTRSRIAGGRTLIGGAYAEAWDEIGPWLISGGVRFDAYRAYGGHRLERTIATNAVLLDLTPADSTTTSPTARLGFRRAFGETFLRGAVYQGFRPPTLNELYRPFRVGNDVTEANASLRPEHLTGVDFGIGGTHRSWSWDVGIFVNRLDDAIVNVTLGAGPGTFPPGVFVPVGGVFRQRRNAGDIDAEGVEAQARGQIDRGLWWRAALNYTDAKLDGGEAAPSLTGLRPAQSPRWTATAGLNWQIQAATRLAADISYESARFDDDQNTRVLAGAAVVDVRLEQGIGRRATVYAALDNAFDTDVETAETADGVYSFGAPRTLRVGFRLATPG